MKDKATLIHSNKTKLEIAIIFFVMMILVLSPISTGLFVHELVSVIIILPFIVHIAVSYEWIVLVTIKFLKRQNGSARLKYILDWLLFLVFILVSVSGFLVSKKLLPLFGIKAHYDSFWSLIHAYGSILLMILLGIHIALQWKWVVRTVKSLWGRRINALKQSK